MKLAAMFGSSSGAIGATAVGAVVVIAGAVGITVFNAEPEVAPVAAVETPVAQTPEVVPEAVAVVAEDPEPQSTFEAPRLDVVRVAPDGNTLIAGQTSPRLAVAILLDGTEVAQTTADGSGDFVAILSLAPSDNPRMLSVQALLEGGEVLAGAETVIVAPFAAPVVEVAVVEPEPEPEPEPEAEAVDVVAPEPTAIAEAPAVAEAPVVAPVEQEATIELAAPQPEAAPEPDPTRTPAPEPEQIATLQTPSAPTTSLGALSAPSLSPNAASFSAADTRPTVPQPARALAPAVVIASPEGLRVVQGPTDEPAVQTSVRLDAISYNAEGAVILAGRGPVDADIQVYLNNQPIQLGEIGPGGAWSLQLPDVDPGTYTLAVAEVADDGSTTSRVETPFLREDPERVAEAPAASAAGIDVITVQPGFTLWGMAENTFGDGILYVQIFEENRDQIQDPDWIFPGQIFRMPALDGAASQAATGN